MTRPSTKGFFVKERLTEAREARDMTQADLAKAIGRAGPTVSNWERGHTAPEPSMLDDLASALGVRPGYLLKPVPAHGGHAIFFRSLANAAARARTRERARVRWLQHVSLTLQDLLEFPDVDIPAFVAPGDYLRLDKAELERIATEMRSHWGLGEGPIPSMVLVAENAGVVVGVDEVGSTKIDGQSTWSDVDQRPYMLLASDKNTAFRRQMDVAHELAHLVLHRGATSSDLEAHFDLIEEQAKYLACAFLLPHRAFASEVSSLSLEGFRALKPRWFVSIGAMIMRAREIEMLTEQAAEYLWRYRSARGWHRKEPLDSPEETPVEQPRLMRRSIELIIEAKVRTKRDLIDTDIGLGADTVEMLAALPPNFFAEAPANVVRLEPRFRERAIEDSNSREVVPFKRPG